MKFKENGFYNIMKIDWAKTFWLQPRLGVVIVVSW